MSFTTAVQMRPDLPRWIPLHDFNGSPFSSSNQIPGALKHCCARRAGSL